MGYFKSSEDGEYKFEFYSRGNYEIWFGEEALKDFGIPNLTSTSVNSFFTVTLKTNSYYPIKVNYDIEGANDFSVTHSINDVEILNFDNSLYHIEENLGF